MMRDNLCEVVNFQRRPKVCRLDVVGGQQLFLGRRRRKLEQQQQHSIFPSISILLNRQQTGRACSAASFLPSGAHQRQGKYSHLGGEKKSLSIVLIYIDRKSVALASWLFGVCERIFLFAPLELAHFEWKNDKLFAHKFQFSELRMGNCFGLRLLLLLVSLSFFSVHMRQR